MLVLRWILFPFSLLYGLILEVRNFCYNRGWFPVYAIPVKSISVGNLSTGGTGKTPHVHYLADYLKKNNEVCIVSRGYGRSTKGFKWVETASSAHEVGDEPLFYKKSFEAEVLVAVSENRSEAVQRIMNEVPSISLFLLDDAYQHRAVKCGLSILLTEYTKPFFSDQVLPTGNLREFPHNKERADLVIVTKCPEKLSRNEKERFRAQLNMSGKPIFFSQIIYGVPVGFKQEQWLSPEKVLLVTGIANSNPLLKYVSAHARTEHVSFSDHHDFKSSDIEAIHRKFDTFAHKNAVILTTEKDYVRLSQFISKGALEKYPWFYLPISIQIDEEEKFKSIIDQYVGAV
jgi:tetraacyldisaccharide 4'-kinase